MEQRIGKGPFALPASIRPPARKTAMVRRT
jgi:hypothetical protein